MSAQNKIRFCRNCGAQADPGDRFCKKCGFRFEAAAAGQGPVPGPAAAPQAPAGSFGQGGMPVPAAAQQASAATAKAREILSLPAFLLNRTKQLLGGILGVLRHPRALLPSLVFGAAWILLPILQSAAPDNPVIGLLSWLTYAQGGVNRSGPGILGGLLGKVTTAAALTSIPSGALGQAAAGLGAMFSRGGEKGSAGSTVLGAFTGIVCYLIFAGIGTMGAGSTMAGISGALLCLRSLGSGKGFFYSLAESMTSQVTNGVRTADPGKRKGMLGGMTAGFAVITALSALF